MSEHVGLDIATTRRKQISGCDYRACDRGFYTAYDVTYRIQQFLHERSCRSVSLQESFYERTIGPIAKSLQWGQLG